MKIDYSSSEAQKQIEKAVALSYQGKFIEANKEMQKAIQIEYGDTRARNYNHELGKIFMEKFHESKNDIDFSNAIINFRQAMMKENSKDDPDLNYILGFLYAG